MSLTLLLSFSLLLAAIHGSFGAVLRDRRPNIDTGPVKTTIIRYVDDTSHQASDSDDTLDKVFQKLSSTLGEVDKRQNSNIQVSEAEMLQLINDVNAIGGQLQDWLENGGGSSQPEVSVTPGRTLTSSRTGPSPTKPPTPSGNTPTTACMVTVTETFYEYVYDDPMLVDPGSRFGSVEVEPFVATIAIPTAETESTLRAVASSTFTPRSVTTSPTSTSEVSSSPTFTSQTFDSLAFTSRTVTSGSPTFEGLTTNSSTSAEMSAASTQNSLSNGPEAIGALINTLTSIALATPSDSPGEDGGIVWQTIPLPP
jgi:hypothetical protein